MNILTLDHVSKSYTGRMLFEDQSVYLDEGEKVGVLGINGTGKSTLLKIIAGLETPDSGKVIYANNFTFQMLTQHPEFSEDATVLSAVLTSYVQTINAVNREYDLSEDPTIIAEAKSMLNKLGITDFDQKASELSGGQRKRLALVSVLLHKSDVLLLDEPTNHLDAEMSDWLEDFLKGFRGTIVMVTHDRYFLDSVCNRIIEIDRGSIYSYNENYAGFLEKKAQREESNRASDRKRQSILRNELKWVMRGARARTTKQKARLGRFEELKVSKLLAEDETAELSSIKSRMGRTTIELEELGKSYGDKCLIKDFTYNFLKNDRIGFVGANGAGKTTLLKMIVGEVEPDSGSIIIGQTIKIAYYSQEIPTVNAAGGVYMDPSLRVIDFVKDTAEYIQTVDGLISASKMCERFLFDSEQQYTPIGKLSGGQKRRLHLLRILMTAPNVLILDEPTNDLDIRTLTVLEDYIDHFDGIVIAVSHDRYFLDRVVRRIFAFEGNGNIRQYEGGYTDYQTKCLIDNAKKAPKLQKDTGAAGSKPKGKPAYEKVQKRKLSYKDQKEYDGIEDEISLLEEKIAELDREILKNATDFGKLRELTAQKDELDASLTERMERWEYLENLIAEIEEFNSKL